MKTCQAAYWKEHERYDAHHHHGDYRNHSGQLVLVVKDVHQTEHKDPDHVDGERDEEHEEVSVVPPSYAVVDPGTVVVEYLYAVVTDAAVRTAGRTIELTGDTPFHSDLDRTNVTTPSQPAEF